MAEGGPPAMPPSRESPPKAVVDTSPLLNSLEQNKESLKVKLMLRRPVEQLVAQGIMPPLKTPAAFHGQRRQLERAKTGDLLKTKIQQRPSRLELESRHILEADPHVDPSLAEKQRMLKKARLADHLNDQLSHRPGPLELIQKNILHTEEPIEHAVKAGRIPYKATCEGQLNRPQLPLSYVNPEDDSQSSEDNNASSGPDVLETAAKSAGIVVSLIPSTEGAVVVTTATPVLSKDNSELVFADLCRSVAAPLLQTSAASSPASLVSSTSTLSPSSSIASPVPLSISQPATPAPPPMPVTLNHRNQNLSPARSDAPGKDKNRKKSKSKSTPKTRTIKFHEYKGPPSAQKSSSNNVGGVAGESSYDLLLQQQTLLLQFQLQLQHKYPQIILPAQKVQPVDNQSNNNLNSLNSIQSVPSPAPSTASDSSLSSGVKFVGRLEDMKVSDLKAELKRRSLPVSGSKPQLIERLKPFANVLINSECGGNMDDNTSHNSPGSPQTIISEDQSEHMDVEPMSPCPTIIHIEPALRTQEEIVREQQRQIEELQRELTLSQLKLQAATRAEPKVQFLQKHIHARQQNQLKAQMQELQALRAQHVNEEQQKLQQEQHVAFQNQKNQNLKNLLLNSTDAAVVFNHLVQQGKGKLLNGHVRANSLPNFLNSIVTPVINVKEEVVEKPPPPVYEEATKFIKKEVKSNVKSQIVDDVLEILIKNGELPPSAAQDPLTPIVKMEPQFPQIEVSNNNVNSPESALGLDATDLLDTLDSLENMDFTQLIELSGQQHNNNGHVDHVDSVPMDTDDWLESLLPSENQVPQTTNVICANGNSNCNETLAPAHDDLGYDPLLGIAQDPFDPFCLDEFRTTTDLTASLSWDKVDFTA